jgi:hypothetical protein
MSSSGALTTLQLYRRILSAARHFPSVKKNKIIAEIKSEFRRNKELTQPDQVRWQAVTNHTHSSNSPQSQEWKSMLSTTPPPPSPPPLPRWPTAAPWRSEACPTCRATLQPPPPLRTHPSTSRAPPAEAAPEAATQQQQQQ